MFASIRGRLLLAPLAVWGSLFSFAPAQENEAPKADPPETAQLESSQPKAAAGSVLADYNKLFDEWKEVLKELRRLKGQYSNAKPEDAKGLEEQWAAQIAKGEKLLPQLRQAAAAAYSEEKSVDPQLQRFLLKLTEDSLAADDYEVAYDLAKVVLDRAEADKAPPPKQLYQVAGKSAFMTNRFEEADKYFNLAVDAGTFDPADGGLVASIPKYKEWWATEKKIRETEAKAEGDALLPRVKLSTTAGDFVIELFENEAPETVGNFVSLVEADFYKDVIFHRVLPGFMAQGGDPQGTGVGDPGYNIYCETENPNHRRHFRGTLSMAHAGKDTGGSQFFMCFSPQQGLDGKHTAFGRVIEGMENLSKIQKITPGENKQVEPTKILSAEVLRKRDHKYLPHKVE